MINDEIRKLEQARTLFDASYKISNPPPKLVLPRPPMSLPIVLLIGVASSFLQGMRTLDVFIQIASISASHNLFLSIAGSGFTGVFVVLEGILAFLTIETITAVLPFLYGKDNRTIDLKTSLLLPAILSFITAVFAGLRQTLNLVNLPEIKQFVDYVLVLLIGVGVVFIQASIWHLAGSLLREYYSKLDSMRGDFAKALAEWEERKNHSWAVTKNKYLQRVSAEHATYTTNDTRKQRVVGSRVVGLADALRTFEAVHGRLPSSYEEARKFFRNKGILVNRATLWKHFNAKR